MGFSWRKVLECPSAFSFVEQFRLILANTSLTLPYKSSLTQIATIPSASLAENSVVITPYLVFLVGCSFLRLISLRHKYFLLLFMCPIVWLISKTTEIIRNHPVIERYTRKFPVNYNFSFYPYDTNLTLQEAQIYIHQMSQPELRSVGLFTLRT
jgi:hypothetical protein